MTSSFKLIVDPRWHAVIYISLRNKNQGSDLQSTLTKLNAKSHCVTSLAPTNQSDGMDLLSGIDLHGGEPPLTGTWTNDS